MKVYRIGKTKYARDLTGEGARLNGGRWNHKGTACLYTSESRALAVLEYTVNVNIADIPRALSITSINIKEDNIHHVPIEILPGNWRDNPAPAATKDFGSHWLKAQEHAIIRIASAVIPEECNYLINPLLLSSSLVQIVDVRDFIYDVRIKTT